MSFPPKLSDIARRDPCAQGLARGATAPCAVPVPASGNCPSGYTASSHGVCAYLPSVGRGADGACRSGVGVIPPPPQPSMLPGEECD